MLKIPYQETAKEMRKTIRLGMVKHDLTIRQLSTRCGIPYSTLCRKLHDPSIMTLAELVQILSAVGKEIEVTD